MPEQDASSASPWDTTKLRKLMGPAMRRSEKWTLLPAGQAEDAFLHELITSCLVNILDEVHEFAAVYLPAREASILRAAGQVGAADALVPPPAPPAAPHHFARPQELAALEGDTFLREVSSLAVDELERLAVPVAANEVDMFSAEQRHVIDDILAGRRASNVFEIACDDDQHKTGDILEYEGRNVKFLGLSNEPDRMRVAYVDETVRRDVEPPAARPEREQTGATNATSAGADDSTSAASDGGTAVPTDAASEPVVDGTKAGDEAPATSEPDLTAEAAPWQCPDCKHPPYKSLEYFKEHRQTKHPVAASA